MALILAIGAWLGWLTHEARMQSRAVRVIEKARGKVWYSWQISSFDEFAPNPEDVPFWPKWVVDRIGLDFFGHVLKVRLGGDHVSDLELASVGQLTRIMRLELGGVAKVTSGGYKHLERLTQLRTLSLRGSNVNNEELSSIAVLQHLEELDLSSCEQLTDDGLTHLRGLRHLRVLALEQTKVTDRGMESVSQLVGLQELYINDDAIGDAGIARIADLPSLKLLGAHGCATVSDAGVEQLSHAPALVSLYLSRTQVSDAGMRLLERLRSLREIDVSASRVTQRGSAVLQRANPKLRIYNPPSEFYPDSESSPGVGPESVEWNPLTMRAAPRLVMKCAPPDRSNSNDPPRMRKPRCLGLG
jgi:hypothetical protein